MPLTRLLWNGYAANALLGMAAPLARAAFGRNAELWPVAASVLLTLIWAYLLHRREASWHLALTMGAAGLLSGAAAGALVLYSLTLMPRLLPSFLFYVLCGFLLTRGFIKQMRMEAASDAEAEQWREHFEKMTDEERLQALDTLNREAEELLAKMNRQSRFFWPAVVGGAVVLALGIWIRFFMPR